MTRVLVCGAVNWDTTCFVTRLPSPGEEVMCTGVSEVSGGTGANVAVAAARLLGPGQVTLIAALGTDAIARRQMEALRSEGVSTSGVSRLHGHQSGHAYILVDETGQNVIASNLGANAALSRRHVSPMRLASLSEDCRCIALTDPPLPVAEAILQSAAKRAIPVLWDPGILVEHGWQHLGPLMRDVDTLVVNRAEASLLFGAARPDELQRLVGDNGPEHIVLKLGEEGSVAISVYGRHMVRVPPLPIEALGLKVVSSVGCGDVFLGAYASGVSENMDRIEALLLASAASGYNATRPETRGGPNREILKRLMDRATRMGFRTEELEHTIE